MEGAPPVEHLGCCSGRHHLVCHGPLARMWKAVEAAPRALACSQEGVCQGITTARLGRVEPSRAVVAHDAELDHLCTWQQWVWVPPAWGRSAHLFANWAHARLGGALAASPHRYRRQRLEEAREGEICIIAERDKILGCVVLEEPYQYFRGTGLHNRVVLARLARDSPANNYRTYLRRTHLTNTGGVSAAVIHRSCVRPRAASCP